MAATALQGKTDVMGRDGFTWWVGEVEDKEAPQEIGRVRVRILGWYTGSQAKEAYLTTVPTKSLPWATVLLPTDQAGIKNTGTATALEVGAQVLGFFLDGEEAQLPVVIGSFRGFKTDESGQDSEVAKTVIADGEKAGELPEQAQDLSGGEVAGGNPFNKTGEQPANTDGGESTDRGLLGILSRGLEGHYASNPMVIPTSVFGIADGAAGPAGSGFETDLERMLTEAGNLAATLAVDPLGNLVSIVTGKKVDNKILSKAIRGINLAIANGISGIMSWMKEVMAKIIESVIGKLKSLLSNVIPTGIITTLMDVAGMLFNVFCMFEASHILGIIRSAFTNTTAFAKSLANMVVKKVFDGISTAISGAVGAIMGKIKEGLQKIGKTINVIVSAIATARDAIGKFRALVGKITSIFQMDFSKLNFQNIVKLILGLIMSLLKKKNCGRKIRKSRSNFWMPLWGSSTCESPPEFMKREVSVDVVTGKPKTQGDIITEMYQGLKSYDMEIQSFMNGSSIVQDNNAGKQKTIVSDTGGQTRISDSFGNTHYNIPGNETKIIGGDECLNVKGNRCVTIEGDYTLKVNGDFNIEVGGSHNTHQSNGVGLEEGESDVLDANYDGDTPGEQQAKSTEVIAADHEVNYQGTWGLQASNITLTAIGDFEVDANSITNKATAMMNSISGEIINECAWQTNFVNNQIYTMIGMLNPIPIAITGRLTMIKGPDVVLQSEGLTGSLLPAAYIRSVVGMTKPCGIVETMGGAVGSVRATIGLGKGVPSIITERIKGIGAITNSVLGVGTIRYGVTAGKASFGCRAGPTTIYGLPIMLN